MKNSEPDKATPAPIKAEPKKPAVLDNNASSTPINESEISSI
jgi:hypothetical protein